MSAWEKSHALAEPAKYCDKFPTIYLEKYEPEFIVPASVLTRKERAGILKQITKHRRCAAAIIVSRKRNHMGIVWRARKVK